MKNPELKEYKIDIGDSEITLYDIKSSKTLDFVIPEAIVGDEYNTKNIDFKPGDVVLDIGANVGGVSIMLAKKYPFLKIYSYEAHPINYKNLLKNIEKNNITNIEAFNYAVYSVDNHLINISLCTTNTGATNSFIDIDKRDIGQSSNIDVSTISLDTIIKNNNIENLKFLKMDCEGAEFEILESSKLINEISVENLGIEVHLFMEEYGKNTNNLVEHLKKITLNSPIIKYSGL